MRAEPLGLPLPAIADEARRRERNRQLVGLALVAPAAVLVALFLYFPMAFIVQMSFTVGSSYRRPPAPSIRP